MARFSRLVGLGLASAMVITAPVLASTQSTSAGSAAKPAMHQTTTPKKAAAPKHASKTAQATHNSTKKTS